MSSLERELSELTDAKESSERRLEQALQSSKARLRQVSVELQLEASQTAEVAATAAATAAAAQTKERADVQQSRAVAQATEAARLAETRMAAALKESIVGKEGLSDLMKVAETLVGTPAQRHHLHHLGLRLAGVEQALGAAHEMERAQASARSLQRWRVAPQRMKPLLMLVKSVRTPQKMFCSSMSLDFSSLKG